MKLKTFDLLLTIWIFILIGWFGYTAIWDVLNNKIVFGTVMRSFWVGFYISHLINKLVIRSYEKRIREWKDIAEVSQEQSRRILRDHGSKI